MRLESKAKSRLALYSSATTPLSRSDVPLLSELLLGTILVHLFSAFVSNKARITGRQDARLSRVERTNTIISFILSVLALFVYVLHFMVIIFIA